MNRRTLLIVTGAILVAVVVLVTSGWLAFRAGKRAVTEAFEPQEEIVDVATLVTQVRELSRLETAAMRVMHIGTVKQSYQMVPNALAGDEITFLATGDVIAGIDLSRIGSNDMWREPDGTVAIRLPPPQILVTSVDNKESRVLERKTGMLRRADVDLETRARQHAEANIRGEALKKGILRLAATNGEKKLADFLHAAGIQKIRFVTVPPAAPSQR